MEIVSSERNLSHRLFEIGVVIKGIHGLIELVGAFSIYFVSGTTIYNIITSIISNELVEDPNDFLANFLLQHVHVTAHGKDFAALYLFISAIVNIVLAAGLLMHRKHMYPAAKALLGGFVIYQLYLFARTHSPWLLILALYDVLIIALIYTEYRRRWPIESPVIQN